MAFTDQRPLELGKRIYHQQEQGGYWRVLASDGEVFFHELNVDTTLLGNLISHTDNKLQTITLSYDALNRPTSEQGSDGWSRG